MKLITHFLYFMNWTGEVVPEWVGLILCPVILVLATLLLLFLGGRKTYWWIAFICGGVGFFLVLCTSDEKIALGYFALFLLLSGALRLLLFIPKPARKRENLKREEKIFRRFYEPLPEEKEEGLPPKVVCYEEPPAVTAEECGMQLDYATELVKKLKGENLTPTDRLEAEQLSRSVEALRLKPLTEKELGTLNDCLASVLKLIAKYKL